MNDADRKRLVRSIVRVGRAMGVVVGGAWQSRYILTAAHVVKSAIGHPEPWNQTQDLLVPVSAWREEIDRTRAMLVAYEPVPDIAVLGAYHHRDRRTWKTCLSGCNRRRFVSIRCLAVPAAQG